MQSRRHFFNIILITSWIVFSISFFSAGVNGFSSSFNIDILGQDLFKKSGAAILGEADNSQQYSQINYQDKRAYILDQYFLKNQSPLYLQGSNIVEGCEKFNAPKDCTIIAAIAKNETDLCNYYNSFEMKNCWGFGGGGIYRRSFENFKEAIFTITDVLVNQYGHRYIIDPTLMQTTFCGSEPGCENWGSKIKYFVNEIDTFGKNMGLGSILEYRK